MKHDKIERNIGLMLVLVMLAISAGGLVEIIPLFFLDTVEVSLHAPNTERPGATTRAAHMPG